MMKSCMAGRSSQNPFVNNSAWFFFWLKVQNFLTELTASVWTPDSSANPPSLLSSPRLVLFVDNSILPGLGRALWFLSPAGNTALVPNKPCSPPASLPQPLAGWVTCLCTTGTNRRKVIFVQKIKVRIWRKTGSRSFSLPWGKALWSHDEFPNFSKSDIALAVFWTKLNHVRIPWW